MKRPALLLIKTLVAIGSIEAAPMPLHRYQFEETAGATVADSIGTAHGEIKGSGFSWGDGMLALDGGSNSTAAYVDLPNGIISSLENLTVELWVTKDGAQSWAPLFDFGSSSTGELTEPGGAGTGLDLVTVYSQVAGDVTRNRVEVSNLDSVGGGTGGTWTVDLPAFAGYGTEHHAVLTWDGASGTVKYFRDGALVGSLVTGAKPENINDINNWLGRSNFGSVANFQGKYNEFRVYDRVLNPSEVRYSYYNGPGSLLEGAPTRITFDPGNERFPVWDPSGVTIAFSTDRTLGIWNDLGAVAADGTNERLIASGPQSGFGLAPWQGGWLGTSGRFGVLEAVHLHEFLSLDPAQTPHARMIQDGADAAFIPRLVVDGGGGGVLFKVSDDNSTALWRFSERGGGGRTTIRTAPLASLTGQLASSLGTIHVDVNAGIDQLFVRGGDIAPDGSRFVLSERSGSGYDLFLYETATSAKFRLTTSGLDLGASNTYPDISPDGATVAFTYHSGRTGDFSDIYLIDMAGGAASNLTGSQSYSEAWPCWSGDGSQLCYSVCDTAATGGLMAGEAPNWNVYTQAAIAIPATGDGLPSEGDTGPDGTAPRITSPLAAFGVAGQPFIYQITATNSPDDFSASGLPLGLIADETTGEISGAPAVSGTWSVLIDATNSEGRGIATLTITIDPADAGVGAGCLAYEKLTRLNESFFGISLASSHDGGRLAWASSDKRIFTMAGDGSGLAEIFDYDVERPGGPFLTPYVDISADGSKVIWTDTVNEIWIADFDGSNRMRIATGFFNPFGGNDGPQINTKPRLNADGSKVYFTNSIGHGGEFTGGAGLYEINADGTGQTQLFSYPDMAAAVFGTDGSEYNGNIAFQAMDVSDDGSSFIFGTFQNGGAVFVWDRFSFRTLITGGEYRDESVAISGNGRFVAYSGALRPGFTREVVGNRFGGGAAQTLAVTQSVHSLSLDSAGAKVSIGAGGKGDFFNGILTNPSGGYRLDLTPHATFAALDVQSSVLSGNGRRIFTVSALNDTVPQIWAIEINPDAAGGAGYPQISDSGFAPDAIPVDGSLPTVVSAHVVPSAQPLLATRYEALLNGEIINDGAGGISDRSFRGDALVDDGLVRDETAGDGIYTSGDTIAFRNPPLGRYTIRVSAIEAHRMLAKDFNYLQIYAGSPEAFADGDGDGAVDLLEEAFGGNPEKPDPQMLPRIAPSPGGESLALAFRRKAGGAADASGDYNAGALTYRCEFSADGAAWQRVDPSDAWVTTAPSGDGMESAMVNFAPDFLAARSSVMIRIAVSRR